MSKITQAKKEAKATGKELKGKQKKIAESEAKKKESSGAAEDSKKQGKSSIPNLNKCCTCTHYPAHFHGEAQPCKIKKAYVARKCDACSSYKCKYQ